MGVKKLSLSKQTTITKIRAIYGKMIKKDEYKNILSCSNIKEFVDLIQNRILYKEILEVLDRNNLNIDKVEKFIKNKALLNYARIYKLIKENKILNHLIRYFEIDEILRITTLIEENRTKIYVVDLPTYLALKCKINIFEFSKIENFEELLNVLKNTKYEKFLLKNFNEKNGVDFLKFEHMLYKDFFKNLLKTIRDKTKNVELYELNRLIKTKIDILNSFYIFREKIIFKTGKEEIEKRVFPFYKNLKKEKIEKILEAQTANQMEEDFKKVYSKINEFKLEKIETNLKQKEYDLCKHYLNISQNVTTVFYCFFILQKIEVENLIHIVEGIRYNLKKEEIENFLII